MLNQDLWSVQAIIAKDMLTSNDKNLIISFQKKVKIYNFIILYVILLDVSLL
jgi:hypothetical protein